MIDFYKIPDNTPKPDWPEKIGLVKIDGLEIDDFEDLKSRKLVPTRFDYWTDFRWDSKSTLDIYNLVLRLYPKLNKSNISIKSVNIFHNILLEAVKDSSGLIAYSD